MAEVTFNSLPSNRSNLVNWFKVSSGSMSVASGVIENTFCFDDGFARGEFSRPYPRVRQEYAIPLIVGEEVSFFTNFKDTSEIPLNASVKVFQNIDGGKELTSLFSILKTSLVSGNIHVAMTPNEGLKEFTSLRLVLDNSGVTHISRPFVIMPDFNNIFRVTFEPQNSVYFNYPYLDDNIEGRNQSLLVHGNLTDVEFTGESETYTEVSTGREREELKVIGRRLNVETYFLDLLGHEAMAAAFFHKNVKVNDLNVTSAGNYEPNMQHNMDISKGTVELIDLDYGHRIKSC